MASASSRGRPGGRDMSVTIIVDHRVRLGPVKDQGRRPTCLSHAATLSHESARRDTEVLSAEYLHWFAATTPGGGAKLDAVAESLRDRGQPPEIACPYFPGEPPQGWAPSQCTTFRRASEERDAEADEVHRLIHQDYTPLLVLMLPEAFYCPQAPWVVPSKGPIRGTHAVVGVGAGIHAGTRVVLTRNSWGVGWGDAGHVWLDDTFLRRYLLRVLILTHEVSSA